MKSKDVALIIAIAGFAGVFALIISNIFLASPKNLVTTVEVVEPISTEFKIPDQKYFNNNSVNPTRLIQIRENQNPNPFQ